MVGDEGKLEGRVLYYVTERCHDSYGRQYRNHHGLLIADNANDPVFLSLIPPAKRDPELFQRRAYLGFEQEIADRESPAGQDEGYSYEQDIGTLVGVRYMIFFKHLTKDRLSELGGAEQEVSPSIHACLNELENAERFYLREQLRPESQPNSSGLQSVMIVRTYVNTSVELSHEEELVTREEMFLGETQEDEDAVPETKPTNRRFSPIKLKELLSQKAGELIGAARRKQNGRFSEREYALGILISDLEGGIRNLQPYAADLCSTLKRHAHAPRDTLAEVANKYIGLMVAAYVGDARVEKFIFTQLQREIQKLE